MNMPNENTNTWFYIKHKSTNRVIATSECEAHARSQAVVIKPQHNDNELWCWDGHFLKNKSTGLVLDIRKGRLRLIEDTEICLYYKKPQNQAHNQKWAVRPASTTNITTSKHPLFKEETSHQPPGFMIYPLCNRDWVLDVHDSTEKLVLLQYQEFSKSQVWELVFESDVINKEEEPSLTYQDNSLASSISDDSSAGQITPGSSISFDFMDFAPHGLSPSKRSSQTSLNSNSRKGSLENIYLYQAQQVYSALNK
ncbi:hypothetical protein BD770DRAFT_414842 [Pilaira anomala]|nr:hypothetical protein BD770DRAFT_414842 [Pilaira anomala]